MAIYSRYKTYPGSHCFDTMWILSIFNSQINNTHKYGIHANL
jgi:hypothetical protein